MALSLCHLLELHTGVEGFIFSRLLKVHFKNIRWHGSVAPPGPFSYLHSVWWVELITCSLHNLLQRCHIYTVPTQSIDCPSVFFVNSVPVSWGLCGGGLWHRGGGGKGLQTGLHLLQEKERGRGLCHHRMVLQGQGRSRFCSCECKAAIVGECLIWCQHKMKQSAGRCHALKRFHSRKQPWNQTSPRLHSSRHRLFI